MTPEAFLKASEETKMMLTKDLVTKVWSISS